MSSTAVVSDGNETKFALLHQSQLNLGIPCQVDISAHVPNPS